MNGILTQGEQTWKLDVGIEGQGRGPDNNGTSSMTPLKQDNLRKSFCKLLVSVKLGAGAGFEPATFRL
jgi:hypothetical protein